MSLALNGLSLQCNTEGGRNAIQHIVMKYCSQKSMSRNCIPGEPELESIAKYNGFPTVLTVTELKEES